MQFIPSAESLVRPLQTTADLCFSARLATKQKQWQTQALLTARTPVICEAAFTWYGNFCAADILRREEKGYALYEVKNSFSVRQEFITDLGFQRLILRKCGVNVLSCNLVLRGDPPEAFPPDPFENRAQYLEKDGFRYKIVDVSKEAREKDFLASQRIFELGKLKKKDVEIPKIEVGEHCTSPYPCWYYEHCHNEK